MKEYDNKNTEQPYNEGFPGAGGMASEESENSIDNTDNSNKHYFEPAMDISGDNIANEDMDIAPAEYIPPENAGQNIDNDDGTISESSRNIENIDIIPNAPAQIKSAPDFPNNGSFFTETIKKKSRGDKRFRKNAVIFCLVSILGGGSLGLGLSIGGTITNHFLMPFINPASDSVAKEEVKFSFDGIAAKPAVVESQEAVNTFNASQQVPMSYADIIAKVEPSVVCISSTLAGQDSFFDSMIPASGTGSGILFFESDLKYYIVTNYHVIQNAVDINVSIEGSDPIPAMLVDSDGYNDLAVIYINKSDAVKAGVEKVSLATFGDSDNMQVGDIVLAIGNAMGEGNIATNGILSAKDKTIVIQRNVSLTVLQTNAAINPGNSGGPLVNYKGEVIGINTAKISESNTEGMGYSIPSNIAKPIIQDFMDSINRPYIGVQIVTLTPETASQYNLISAGALVEGIVEGSPAEKAGIKTTDIITGFNGEPILTGEQLVEAVSACEIGDVVEIKLIRGGKENITVEITLEKKL